MEPCFSFKQRPVIKKKSFVSVFLFFVLIAGFLTLNSCSGSRDEASGASQPSSSPGEKKESSFLGIGKFPGSVDSWSNEAIRLSFNYPAEGRVKVDPDLNETLRIEYTQDLVVALYLKKSKTNNPAEFKKLMNEEIDRMPGYTGGFREIRRGFSTVSGLPAAYVEYLWKVMRQDFHVHALWIWNQDYQYEFVAQFLESKYEKMNPVALAILNSIKILKGPVNPQGLTAADSRDGSQFDLHKFLHGSGTEEAGNTAEKGETTGKKEPGKVLSEKERYYNYGPVLALSKSTGKQNSVQMIIEAEYGDKAVLADWEYLKKEIGEQLPLALMSAGLQDGQAAWVSYRNNEYFMGNRHYFVQRFDSGAPKGFLAHDRVGNMYLGSWYDLDIPVLVVRKIE